MPIAKTITKGAMSGKMRNVDKLSNNNITRHPNCFERLGKYRHIVEEIGIDGDNSRTNSESDTANKQHSIPGASYQRYRLMTLIFRSSRFDISSQIRSQANIHLIR
jgi:hypothetical protein